MKLGFLVNDLGPSQFNYLLIKGANNVVGSRSDTDIVAFYENLTKPCLPMNFAAMQIAEAWAFDGVAVATTFSTAEKLLRFPSPTKRLFYVWDLEWLRHSRKLYRELHAVYGHPDLTLIARGVSHAKAISEAWNRDVSVIENLDMERFCEQ